MREKKEEGIVGARRGIADEARRGEDERK